MPAASQIPSKRRSKAIDGTTATNGTDSHRETGKARAISPRRKGTTSLTKRPAKTAWVARFAEIRPRGRRRRLQRTPWAAYPVISRRMAPTAQPQSSPARCPASFFHSTSWKTQYNPAAATR